MTHVRLKLSVAAVILAGAVGFLAFAGAQKGWVYTLGVDQYRNSPQQQAQRVRLCGKVAEENLEIHKAQLTARFLLKGEHAAEPIAFHGVIPDMFKAGVDVVVEGKQDSAGVFQADLLMTKCARKYEDMPKGHPNVQKDAPQAGGQS